MKKNWLLIGGMALLLIAAVLMVNSANHKPPPANATARNLTPAPQHEHLPERRGQDCAGTF